MLNYFSYLFFNGVAFSGTFHQKLLTAAVLLVICRYEPPLVLIVIRYVGRKWCDYLCNKFSCRQHQVGDFVDLFLFYGKVSETVLLGFSVASSLILGMLNYKMFHSYDVVF